MIYYKKAKNNKQDTTHLNKVLINSYNFRMSYAETFQWNIR